MARRSYRGNSVGTTLSVGATSSDTSLTLTDASSFPTGTFPFVVTLDFGQAGEEKVLAYTRSGNVLTGVSRGYDGTAPSAHSAGATARHTLSATDLDEANAHVNATSGVHGTTGTIVDTTSAQTLTNKSLTQAQTHGSADTDSLPTSLHHTIGTSATQAAAGNHVHGSVGVDPRSSLLIVLNPPTGATGVVAANAVQGGTGAFNNLDAYTQANTGSVSGNTNYLYRHAESTSPYLSGYVDVSGLASFTTTGTSPAGSMNIGVGDSATSTFALMANGASVNVSEAGVVTALKRTASVSSSNATTAGTVAQGAKHYFRVRYPLAGGTATFFVDGVQVATVGTCPALNAGAIYMGVSLYNSSSTAQMLFQASQLTITD